MVVKTNVEDYLIEFQDLIKLFGLTEIEDEIRHEEIEESGLVHCLESSLQDTFLF